VKRRSAGLEAARPFYHLLPFLVNTQEDGQRTIATHAVS
jgi:hypothetical protein